MISLKTAKVSTNFDEMDAIRPKEHKNEVRISQHLGEICARLSEVNKIAGHGALNNNSEHLQR
jgi:hypothetical protein